MRKPVRDILVDWAWVLLMLAGLIGSCFTVVSLWRQR